MQLELRLFHACSKVPKLYYLLNALNCAQCSVFIFKASQVYAPLLQSELWLFCFFFKFYIIISTKKRRNLKFLFWKPMGNAWKWTSALEPPSAVSKVGSWAFISVFSAFTFWFINIFLFITGLIRKFRNWFLYQCHTSRKKRWMQTQKI